jgi:hypothetical protein
MNKSMIVAVVAVVSVLVFGAFRIYAETSSSQTGSRDSKDSQDMSASSSMNKSMGDSGFGMYRLDRLIGSDVRDAQGESLGDIKDFVVDSQGRVAFALLGHGGFLGLGEKYVAVPFTALNFNGEDHKATTNISRDQLANAPVFDRNTSMDHTWAENSYRYFGQTPYWSETGSMQSDRFNSNTMNRPESHEGQFDRDYGTGNQGGMGQYGSQPQSGMGGPSGTGSSSSTGSSY